MLGMKILWKINSTMIITYSGDCGINGYKIFRHAVSVKIMLYETGSYVVFLIYVL